MASLLLEANLETSDSPTLKTTIEAFSLRKKMSAQNSVERFFDLIVILEITNFSCYIYETKRILKNYLKKLKGLAKVWFLFVVNFCLIFACLF